jgi:hypothetical protein
MTVRTKQQIRIALTAVPLSCLAAACARLDTNSQVDVKPIEVKPIHITVDVNVRIDRELDNFFAFEEDPAAATKPGGPAGASQPATTRPTTQNATTQTGSQS